MWNYPPPCQAAFQRFLKPKFAEFKRTQEYDDAQVKAAEEHNPNPNLNLNPNPNPLLLKNRDGWGIETKDVDQIT